MKCVRAVAAINAKVLSSSICIFLWVVRPSPMGSYERKALLGVRM
jgi:hypothetical protein